MILARRGLSVTSYLQPCRHKFRASLYSTASSDKRHVAILGGGITGLTSAYFLSKIYPKTEVVIYEAGPRIGGWLSSKTVPVDDGHVLFEAGPRTLRGTNPTTALAMMLV